MFVCNCVSMCLHCVCVSPCRLQYLSVADRQTLIPDLVRYICCVVHPTNEILASNVIPRWAVIGWLLMSCQVSKVKLVHYTVKAEIFGGVLFSVTSAPTIFTENKTHLKFRYYRYCIHVVLVHLPGKRVLPKKNPPPNRRFLENTENITPPKISAFTVKRKDL